MNAIQAMSAFYPRYYLQNNPDVLNAFGNDEVAAARHYAEFGINEFRSPNPFFEPAIYKTFPDLKTFSGADLLNHWIDHGINELRRGSKHFHLSFYVENDPTLKQKIGRSADGLFNHWLDFGNFEGRITAEDNRILRIGRRDLNDGRTEFVAATAGPESNDPDLFKPFNTTGGKIGFGAGLVVGTVLTIEVGGAGAPLGGALGAVLGHGIDRILAHVANDITGPAWHDLEQGPVGKLLGKMNGAIGGNFKNVGGILVPVPKFPKISL